MEVQEDTMEVQEESLLLPMQYLYFRKKTKDQVLLYSKALNLLR